VRHSGTLVAAGLLHAFLCWDRVCSGVHEEKGSVTVNKFLIAVVLTIAMTSAHAESARVSYSLEAPAYYYNKAVDDCSHSTLTCLKQLLFKPDQDLDEIYQGRFSFLPKSEFDGLRAAQQAWVLSRENNCSWLGKRRSDIYYLCMLEGSINRKYWLLRNIGD
jgi:uncharacterized protein YecT (DUF1311 family)